jgi:hypothetical protein
VDSVFLLWHICHLADGNDDEKLIGVYQTEDEARAAIGRLRDKPGFSQTPDGFQIVSYTLMRIIGLKAMFLPRRLSRYGRLTGEQSSLFVAGLSSQWRGAV